MNQPVQAAVRMELPPELMQTYLFGQLQVTGLQAAALMLTTIRDWNFIAPVLMALEAAALGNRGFGALR